MTHAARKVRMKSGLALLVAGVFALAGCSSSAPAAAETTQTPEAAATAEAPATEWPRTFENSDGTTTEIPAQPERIVSTTVTATGSLLTIDAPVVASTTAANGNFFPAWASLGESKGVEKLFPVGEVDLEAIIAQDPDLIIVARGGADSLIDNVAELQAIAPTIVIDYGKITWQELAEQFGQATGLEQQATDAVTEYNDYVAAAKGQITVPEGTATIFSFNGPGEHNNIARAGGVHADVLESLGFAVEDPNPEWHTIEEQRSDFVFATYENLTELTSETCFILAQDDEGAQAFAQDPAMANVPCVKAGQVFGLGKTSFRIDKFAGTQIADHVIELFGSN